LPIEIGDCSFHREVLNRKSTIGNESVAGQHRIEIKGGQLQEALEVFFGSYKTTGERISAVKAALESGSGRFWREELGKWTVRVVPVELLVPMGFRPPPSGPCFRQVTGLRSTGAR